MSILVPFPLLRPTESQHQINVTPDASHSLSASRIATAYYAHQTRLKAGPVFAE